MGGGKETVNNLPQVWELMQLGLMYESSAYYGAVDRRNPANYGHDFGINHLIAGFCPCTVWVRI